jgi:CspA family cold shock protein
MAKREVGTVKWFNDSKGFGFITRDEGNDLFVHHNSIIAEGFKTLKENAKVEFDVIKTDKGEAADKVTVI